MISVPGVSTRSMARDHLAGSIATSCCALGEPERGSRAP